MFPSTVIWTFFIGVLPASVGLLLAERVRRHSPQLSGDLPPVGRGSKHRGQVGTKSEALMYRK
ncbi:MAG TPA: hypothetical protein DDZ42_19425 [Candidatus Rokubacteria bacterium]|nr:hypothetical protein [Candidatus Rokubacteria bacterium]